MKSKYNKLSKNLLHKYYIIKEKTIKEISIILKVGTTIVWRRLKKYNIPLRDRGTKDVWNKGLDKTDPRIIVKSKKQSESLKRSYAEGKIKPWNKGLTIADPRIKSAIEKRELHFVRPKGKEGWTYGFKHTQETKNYLSLVHGGTGVPYEDTKYPKEFVYIRDSILKRDNYTCRVCNMTQEEHLIVFGRELEVHHINYKKIDNKEANLITLCKQCHLRTNYNRNYWQAELLVKVINDRNL